MLLLSLVAIASPNAPSYTRSASALRAELLRDYDVVVPPSSAERISQYAAHAGMGTDVALQIRFFKIESVEQAAQRMRLKVWLRMQWVDERLQWDPLVWNVSKTFFQVKTVMDEVGVNEIWTPDLVPYNSGEFIGSSLDLALATVTHDGVVFYSRPGALDVLCKFSGLVAFPFDTLRCSIEIGGWALSGIWQGVELMGTGWSYSAQEVTSGTSYQEYSIARVEVHKTDFFYDSSPSEPWPNVRFDLRLHRATLSYKLMVILPTMILSTSAMAVCFMSPEVGERLSFGITLILANEVMKFNMMCVGASHQTRSPPHPQRHAAHAFGPMCPDRSLRPGPSSHTAASCCGWTYSCCSSAPDPAAERPPPPLRSCAPSLPRGPCSTLPARADPRSSPGRARSSRPSRLRPARSSICSRCSNRASSSFCTGTTTATSSSPSGWC